MERAGGMGAWDRAEPAVPHQSLSSAFHRVALPRSTQTSFVKAKKKKINKIIYLPTLAGDAT